MEHHDAGTIFIRSFCYFIATLLKFERQCERRGTARHSKSVGKLLNNYVNKNSSGDEIANVNFYAVPYARKVHEFAEITQYNGHYAVQGHSRSPTLVPIESSYDFLLVIKLNTNLPPILHRFLEPSIGRKSLYFATPLVFNSPGGGVPLGRSP